ncbi:MAG: TetR/AcrR family transcriptional regulator [Solirubrobacteraceae bacterium]
MSSYGGVSKAARIAERRGRLLEAGLEIAGRDGWNAATVRAICASARLTPRYFYESFSGREELLLEVFDRIVEEAAAAVLAAVVAAPASDARAKSHVAIDAFLGLLESDPRKARVAFVEALGEEALAHRRQLAIRSFAALVAAQARSFYGAAADAAIVDVSALLLVGGLADLLLAWFDGELELSREELIASCAELFAAIGEATGRIAGRP